MKRFARKNFFTSYSTHYNARLSHRALFYANRNLIPTPEKFRTASAKLA